MPKKEGLAVNLRTYTFLLLLNTGFIWFLVSFEKIL